MLRLAAERNSLSVIADQYGAPTSAALIADITAQIVGQYQKQDRAEFPFGTYNLVAGGITTWHQYAQTVIQAAHAAGKQLKLEPEAILPTTTADYPLPAPRPANSSLSTRKLCNNFGLHLPDWRSGLQHVLQQIL